MGPSTPFDQRIRSRSLRSIASSGALTLAANTTISRVTAMMVRMLWTPMLSAGKPSGGSQFAEMATGRSRSAADAA
jgi:hypothetical protein